MSGFYPDADCSLSAIISLVLDLYGDVITPSGGPGAIDDGSSHSVTSGQWLGLDVPLADQLLQTVLHLSDLVGVGRVIGQVGGLIGVSCRGATSR